MKSKASTKRPNTTACPVLNSGRTVNSKGESTYSEVFKTEKTTAQAASLIEKLEQRLSGGCANYKPTQPEPAFKSIQTVIPTELWQGLAEYKVNYGLAKKQLLAAAIHQFLAMPESDRLRLCRDTLAEYYAA